MVTCDLFIKTAGDDVARKGKRNEKVKREVGGEWKDSRKRKTQIFFAKTRK